MANFKKLLSAPAAGGGGLNVEDVFSTYLYTGNSSSQSISNGIDLSTEGGMVWLKSRTVARSHFIADTERGSSKTLSSDNSGSETTDTTRFTAFNTDGFSVGGSSNTNNSGENFASWAFRKAPKFFDVVTYTGDSVAGREIAHNLGTTVGTVIIKCTSNARNWRVWHRSLSTGQSMVLNSTGTVGTTNILNSTAPTDSVLTLSSDADVNNNGFTYVAYLFAHNDGDGDFGPAGDQDIIKCGSYIGNGNYFQGNEVDIGFEPQWIITKKASDTGDWMMLDVMRGMPVYGGENQYYDKRMFANATSVEDNQVRIDPMPNGFRLRGSDGDHNANGATYIYIAIRRGPMAVPESATDVFAIDTGSYTDPPFDSGFPVDLAIKRSVSGGDNWMWMARQQGTWWLRSNDTNNANNIGTSLNWDHNDGWYHTGQGSNVQSWMWRRAPNFCDVVSYVGTSGTAKAYDHNLGAVPEMIITKRLDGFGNWPVYHKDLGNTDYLLLNGQNPTSSDSTYWNNTSPTDTQFTLGANYINNSSGYNVAYLFATLSGISKVGSYTGNGTSQTIDCGFSAGARFVMVRKTDTAGSWWIFDTQLGIAAGNETHLRWDQTSGPNSSYDSIDPANSGFIVVENSETSINTNGGEYIFYAIA